LTWFRFWGSGQWRGWDKDIEGLTGDQGLFIFPPLVAEGPEIGERSKIVAPILEIYKANVVLPGLDPNIQ